MIASEAKWHINRRPRFTVLELGKYMVSEDGPRETILRDMRFERISPTLMYRHLYRAIPRYLASHTRDHSILDHCRETLKSEQASATTPRARDNCTYALRALDTFERSLNALPLGGLTLELAPAAPPLKLSGVSVSVQPTADIRLRRARGDDLAGALLIDVAKGVTPATDEAKSRASKAMSFASMLLNQYVVSVFPGSDPRASTEHCIVFHTHRQVLVACPTNYRHPLRNMEAVCANIKRGWDGIEPPSDFDPAFAIYRG